MEDQAPPPPGEPARPGPGPAGRTRRWFLAGGAAVLAGAGAGVGIELLGEDEPSRPPLAPPVLVAAAEAERALIADLSATTGGAAEVRPVIAQAQADHRAHLAALEALLTDYRRPSATPSPRRGAPRTLSQLRSAETAAATAAARRARALTGRTAALLASIAACESSHAELLR